LDRKEPKELKELKVPMDLVLLVDNLVQKDNLEILVLLVSREFMEIVGMTDLAQQEVELVHLEILEILEMQELKELKVSKVLTDLDILVDNLE